MTIASPDERRARLARRHALAPRERLDDVAAVADAMVALHSSDPVSVYLSAAARLQRPTVGAVDAALYDDRTVVRHHAMRRTLWVLTPELARAAHAGTTCALVAPLRRSLGKLLVENTVTADPERWLDDAIAATMAALAERGEATTRELGEAVPSLRAPLAFASGKSYGGAIAAHTRVLTLMGFMGLVVRGRPLGSWISGQYRWVAADEWLAGGFGEFDPDAARAVVADRYLRTFGPASMVDVQWWTGWTKRATTAALERAAAVGIDGFFVAAGDMGRTEPPPPWCALLPGLDPTTMGWKERSWYLPDGRVAELVDRNGNAGPTIWVDGRIVGGWAQAPDGSIVTRLHEQIGTEHRDLLGDEIRRLEAFVGATRFTIRFPTPLSRDLANRLAIGDAPFGQ